MYATAEQFAAQHQANVAMAVNAAHILVGSAEKLVHLNLATLRRTLDDGATAARTLSDAKSLQDVGSLTLAEPRAEAATAYARSLYEIAAATQAELQKLVEARFAGLNQDLMAQLDQASKAAPAGSEAVMAMFKNSVAAANSAYDTLSKAAKQAAEATEASVAPAPAPKKKSGKA